MEWERKTDMLRKQIKREKWNHKNDEEMANENVENCKI